MRKTSKEREAVIAHMAVIEIIAKIKKHLKRSNVNDKEMRKIVGLIVILFMGVSLHAQQNIRNNKFGLPVLENEIAFLRFDTVKNVSQTDFYNYSKDWFEQTFNLIKLNVDDKKNSELAGDISFKIDDENNRAPLYYTGTVSLKFINGVARFKLHHLKYSASDNSKSSADVTYQVQQQVRTKFDVLYPDTWNSLKDYAAELYLNYENFIADKEIEKL